MKFITILIIIIILALGGWYFFNMSEPADQTDDNGASVQDTVTGEENSSVTGDGSNSSSNNEATDAKVFDLVGSNFKFDVKEIKVKEGDTVTINFEAAEGMHDWVVDEFNASTKRVGAGEKASVTFVADKAGTFEYYCSVGSHRQLGMVGKLIVE